jgi:hypothetical protein
MSNLRARMRNEQPVQYKKGQWKQGFHPGNDVCREAIHREFGVSHTIARRHWVLVARPFGRAFLPCAFASFVLADRGGGDRAARAILATLGARATGCDDARPLVPKCNNPAPHLNNRNV